MTHTPGPWRSVADGTAGMSHEIRARYATVARVYSAHKEHKENARLIAAAPEMLEALRALIYDCYRLKDDPFYRDSYQKALAAIRKATGEES